MTSQPDEYRLASFITCIGRAGLRIYNSLPFAEEAEKTDMARVIELMEAHCVGEANVTYERFVLDQRRQNHGEPFDKFLTSVREQAQRCRFGDQESDMIRDRIVCGVHDQGLRKQLLQRKNLSLADCVDLCRAYEATEKRAKTMSGADTEVHRVQKQYVPKSSKVKSKRYQSKDTVKVSAKTECQYCGLQHAKGRVNCPANGKQCSKCGKLNHYARKCRSQPSVKSRVHCAQESVSSDEAEELMTLTLTGQHDVNAVRTAKYRPQIMATMLLEGKSMVQFQVDTGASCNVIRRADVPKHVKLESTPQVLTLYDRSKVTPVGRCTLRLKNPRNNRNYRAHFVVVDRAAVSILGSRAAQQMQLVTVQYDRIQLLDAPSTHPAVETDKDLMTVENVSERYPQVFDGKVGSLGQPLQLDIDETVTPVQIPVRRVPVAMRQPLKAELDNMAIDADEEQDNALLSLKPETVQKIRQATIADDGIKQLKEMIFSGWPDHKKQIPRALTPYFGVRDQLVVQNGLVFCGDRLLVPDQLRSYMLDRVHSTHLGINGCIRRAKQSIWWPGMTGQIRDKIESCEECNKYPVKQSKETLVSHHVPERPWVKVGVDLFEYRSKHYLVISDYQSNFLEMERLYETTSKSVIKSLKQQFARHGIPEHLFSDNGPQFQSQEFAHFADVWNFQHNTASPGYPKSNGKAENAVKVAKRILKKSREAGTDVYLALLDYRNTPSEGLATSPAQRLFNRRTRTLLPTKASLLEPKMNPDESDHQRVNKEKQKANYDRNARDLPQLRPGDTVRVQPLTQKRDVVWPKAVVTNVLPNRSYGILTEHGKELRRNRVHLRKVKEEPVRIPTQQVKDTAGGRNDNHAPQQVVQSKTTKTPKRQIENRPVSTTTSQDNSTRTTRSGRVVKSPKYLQDYVT
ncbi:uncharacterized protein LOC134181605 [Corticium candelabrum]|uniref:uncharacterized protein LOC134181605 n=1 Tax=Corticium candelabrum TaxID=121492 RepID=UPI002E266785|nr:uncharacterized protein LOC134181605 [Corticium candelabrum]